jgi:hypothetical protein
METLHLIAKKMMSKSKLKQAANNSLSKSLEKQKERNEQRAKERFNFSNLIREFDQVIATFPDFRKGKNISKSLNDAALGAFSVFFTQNPSFLSYQKMMQESRGENNATNLFGVEEILSENHIRNLMDEVSPRYVYPVFDYVFDGLNENGYLEMFRSYNNNLVMPCDGTEFHSSQAIKCDDCKRVEHKEGELTYSHSAITPVLVKPGFNKVISLPPEHIVPQDGHDKQDCENAAFKRWIKKHGEKYKDLGVTCTGDDLYSKDPICKMLRKQGFDFAFVCKESSHKTLYEYLNFLKEDIQEVERKHWKGKKSLIYSYRFYNGVPLRDGKNALDVNWCELIIKAEGSDKVRYKNTWVTNFELTEKNVTEIVTDARAHWKIENDNNNTLKTKGYHLEHNFGHGKKHLSNLLMTFNLLSFLFHTVLDLFDEKYSLLRSKLPTRKRFFQDIRTLTTYFCFDDWEYMLDFMIQGLKKRHKPPLIDTS